MAIGFTSKSVWQRVVSAVLTALGAAALVSVGLAVNATMTRADDAADPPAATKPAEVQWEHRVRFYGDEETGYWSLRIRDNEVPRAARFHLLELWKYDRAAKKWARTDQEAVSSAIELPADKPADAPPDTQILVTFHQIGPRDCGLYYAKWKVDDSAAATYFRVGTGGNPKLLPKPVPDGMIADFVPVTQEKSEPAFVPDPRIACNPQTDTRPSN